MIVVQFLRTLKSTWLDLWRNRLAQSSSQSGMAWGAGTRVSDAFFLTYDEARVTCRDIGRLPLVN